MKLSAVLAPLIAAKVPHEVIMQTVQAWEAEQAAAVDEGKEKARERWRRWKAKQPPANAGKRLQTLANDSRGDARVEDNLLPKKITGQEERKKEEDARDARSCPPGFLEFWTLFPNKVGKRDAEKAFAAALRRAPFEAIMAGLRRYVAKTDDRPWCNPTTFLNQDRWEDQPAATQPRSQAPPKRDTYVDAMNRILEGRANGTENLFGTDGDAQRLPAGQRQPRIDAPHLRGGIAGRIVSGSG